MTSSNGGILLGALLGLMAGAGLYHLLGTSSETYVLGQEGLERSESSSEDSSVSTQEASNELPVSQLAPQERKGSSAGASEPSIAPVSDREVADLMSSLRELEATQASGNGRIWGRVVDAQGNGVAGVVIRMRKGSETYVGTKSSSVAAAAPELENMEEYVRRFAESFRESRAYLRELTSDERGGFRFEHLPDTTWNLRAYAEGLIFESEPLSRSVENGTELTFTATSIIEVPVEVFQPDGQRSSGAKLKVKGSGTRSRTTNYAWDPDSPFLRLKEGDYEVQAFSTEMISAREAAHDSEAQSLELHLGAETPSLRFDLRARLSIVGVVKELEDSLAADNYYVTYTELGPQQEVDLKLLAEGKKRTSVRAGAEFCLTDLQPGRIAVGLKRGYSAPVVAHRIVDLQTGQLRCDLEAPALDRSSLLQATVLDSDGDPLDDVRFSLQVARGGRTRTSSASNMRAKDGTYLIEFGSETEAFFSGGADEAEYELHVQHAKQGKRELELSPGQGEITVLFTVPGTLKVTVLGYQGSGYEGRLRVDAKRIKETKDTLMFFGGRGEDLGVDGVKEFTGLEPGPYEVTLTAMPKNDDEGFGMGSQVSSIEINVRSGTNEVDLSIPTLYSLQVHWEDGKKGTTLSLRQRDSGDQFGLGTGRAKLDADGYANFSELSGGEYILSAWAGKPMQMEVTLPSKPIEFVPMEVDCLRVVIADEQGDLARAGFRQGDLIIGKNGQEFEGEVDYGVLRELQTSKTAEVTVLVLRGRKQVEIRVAGAEMGTWQDMGGQLIPDKR